MKMMRIVSNALKIKVGDNDTMSALVSGLIDADLLIILSDIDGLYNKNPRKYEDANLINMVGDINEDIKNMAGAEGSKIWDWWNDYKNCCCRDGNKK